MTTVGRVVGRLECLVWLCWEFSFAHAKRIVKGHMRFGIVYLHITCLWLKNVKRIRHTHIANTVHTRKMLTVWRAPVVTLFLYRPSAGLVCSFFSAGSYYNIQCVEHRACRRHKTKHTTYTTGEPTLLAAAAGAVGGGWLVNENTPHKTPHLDTLVSHLLTFTGS